MALPLDSVNMALFCDFENIALGVRDTKFEKFDIKPVLEKLLVKGSIVVKKAYCDWDRYKGFKASMHEASFELIEIPHVRQSGKNSADIRLVVDALDLCYTKSHVDTFVIISGDSDFSPLVSKLRENAKRVIGVGVKNSTSDLLVANCDEFIFYDDLAREQQRALAKREARSDKRTVEEGKPKHDGEARKAEAIALAVDTFEALAAERSDSGKIWASVLKSALKRRKPDFSEQYYGFRSFGNLLEEAQARGLLEVGRDDKSGTFVSRFQSTAATEPLGNAATVSEVSRETANNIDAAPAAETAGNKKGRGKTRRGGKPASVAVVDAVVSQSAETPRADTEPAAAHVAAAPDEAGKTTSAPRKTRTRATAGTRAKPRKSSKGGTEAAAVADGVSPNPVPAPVTGEAAGEAKAAPAKKTRQAARPRRKRVDTPPAG
jgi:uncharacterized protein (TIGR00288 family)